MATKKINGLYVSLTKLYRGNAFTTVLMQRTYATVDEGDTKITHTGQVRNDFYYIKKRCIINLYVSRFWAVIFNWTFIKL